MKTAVRQTALQLCLILASTAIGLPPCAADEPKKEPEQENVFKRTGKQAGHDAKAATKQAGQAFKQLGKDIGHGTKKTVHEIGEGIKESGKKIGKSEKEPAK